MEHTHNPSDGVHAHGAMKYIAVILVLLIAGIAAWYLMSQKTSITPQQPAGEQSPKEITLSAFDYDTLGIDTIEEEIATVGENINTVDTLENF